MITPKTPLQHHPTPIQQAAVCSAMLLLVEDDLARGITHEMRMYCDGCQRTRPRPGAVSYGRYALCTHCATEYEVARLRHRTISAGQFVRDKRFGEAERYTLPPAPVPFEPDPPYRDRA
jgi:hypothetical protein